MNSEDVSLLREQLRIAITGGESHITFDEVIKDFPFDKRAEKPHGAPHSAWELVEHMRIAQKDILEFSRNASHQSPNFPEGYWPQNAAPPDEEKWRESVRGFQQDARELADLINREDLFRPFSHGSGQTLLREALVAANHNSYHLGELVFLKRMLLGK
jgi:hypothetical protein